MPRWSRAKTRANSARWRQPLIPGGLVGDDDGEESGEEDEIAEDGVGEVDDGGDAESGEG